MKTLYLALALLITAFIVPIHAQVEVANRSGFTWIDTDRVEDKSYGAGYSLYSAAWPIFDEYPGSLNFQMGLAGCWLTTQRMGDEPDQFYTTIEGGLGWWRDTRFGTRIPKFIMGGVSYNFFAWANGPGAGRSNTLPNGQRDWSSPGGKYGIAQLSNRLLWAPDGLNMAQSLNGERLGYGYMPLPITDVLTQTNGQDVTTGNQCWTLFLNTTNFKGPATFFLPTFWTEPVLQNPELEGLFLDSRVSEPNVGFGIEHAESPALVSKDDDGNAFAKIQALQFPKSETESSMLLSDVSVYNKSAIWDAMTQWFDGGPVVSPDQVNRGRLGIPFVNNGGSMIGEISGFGEKNRILLDYINPIQHTSDVMGYSYDLDQVTTTEDHFVMPSYFSLNSDKRWQPIDEADVPASTDLLDTPVPNYDRPELTYLTPMEADCAWQDPDGPWQSPGPTAGPFTAELGDGSTVTYYWYRFVDQPAVIHANYPEDVRAAMQERVERIHTHWKHTDNYVADPEVGNLATLDPAAVITPPAGLEVGYVPIVTRQEKSKPKVRVFVLAGQSNMQGYGTVVDVENDPGSLVDVVAKDDEGLWSGLGTDGDWTVLDDAYLYFERPSGTIRDRVTVGQGANANLIGPELMFAHQVDEYYDDPVLIIKTAWGGKSLAVDFRPPSAGGETGEYYDAMIQTVKDVTENLAQEFPDLGTDDYEIMGLAWFQGWNDGAEESYLDEYESNLNHLVNDARRDLNNPNLPLVVASAGQGGFENTGDLWVQQMQERVATAQEAVGCNDSLYGGRLGFVNTKEFYLGADSSPQNGIHHYHNNALTFLNVGKAMGKEMILAINDMAYCYQDCSESVAPGIVSIGNRVWNDLNRNGINDPEEPGIAGVSLVLWEDSDGDDIPDWQGFLGVQVTDEEGYYQFAGLEPGKYIVFVWQVDNWEEGQPLHGFVSTEGFVADADNDVDLDNNGSGAAFSDIKSGIVTLTSGGEPLGDGDVFNCFFDYDGSGNNTIDFGFYDPTVTATVDIEGEAVRVWPNPVRNQLMISVLGSGATADIFDVMGSRVGQYALSENVSAIDLSGLAGGIYVVKVVDHSGALLSVQRVVKQ